MEAYPNRLVVEAGGLGYEVMIPLTVYDRLGAVEGSEVDLRTHLHIRETAHTLYGFATDEERGLFLLLVERVSGIGPVIAMAVLSGMPVGQFKGCVVAGDVAALAKIKGLGKKTAERIILELKDKVGVAETWQEAAAATMAAPALDAELALIALGFKQVDARKAVRQVLAGEPDAGADALVRGALRVMA